MVDLLAPNTTSVSLKDASAAAAQDRLLHYQVESYEDIFEVGTPKSVACPVAAACPAS